jgi:hypothetical protein
MVKNVHIGQVITGTLEERDLSIELLASKVDVPESILSNMLINDDIACNVLYKISKVLEYDFFRYYSFHLIHTTSADKGLLKKVRKKAEPANGVPN